MLIYISMSYYLLSNSLSSLNCTWFCTGFTVSNAVLCGFYALVTQSDSPGILWMWSPLEVVCLIKFYSVAWAYFICDPDS